MRTEIIPVTYKKTQEREDSLTKFNRCRRPPGGAGKNWSFRKRQQCLDASHKCLVLHTDTEKPEFFRVWPSSSCLTRLASHFHPPWGGNGGWPETFNYHGHTRRPEDSSISHHVGDAKASEAADWLFNFSNKLCSSLLERSWGNSVTYKMTSRIWYLEILW